MNIEKLQDFTKQLVGTSKMREQVFFKKDVEKYQKDHPGSTPDEAEKETFLDRTDNLRYEINSEGVIDINSSEFKKFLGAIESIFDKKQVLRFLEDAENPAIFIPYSLPSPTPIEINKVKRYYQNHFEGEVPNLTLVKDFSQNTKLIEDLIEKILTDPRIGVGDIKTTLTSNPDIGAKLGKILQARKVLEKHEIMFGKELKEREKWKKFQEELLISGSNMLKAPIEFTQKMPSFFSKAWRGDMSGLIVSIMREVSVVGIKELKAASNIAMSLGLATASSIDKNIFNNINK